jgi:hypothetical protein
MGEAGNYVLRRLNQRMSWVRLTFCNIDASSSDEMKLGM